MRHSLLLAVALLIALALPVRAEEAPAPAFPVQERMAAAQANLAGINATLAALESEYKATRAAAEATVREIEALAELLKMDAPKDEKAEP